MRYVSIYCSNTLWYILDEKFRLMLIQFNFWGPCALTRDYREEKKKQRNKTKMLILFFFSDESKAFYGAQYSLCFCRYYMKSVLPREAGKQNKWK